MIQIPDSNDDRVLRNVLLGGEGIREFSWRHCDACGTDLGGDRHRFAVLGKEVPS